MSEDYQTKTYSFTGKIIIEDTIEFDSTSQPDIDSVKDCLADKLLMETCIDHNDIQIEQAKISEEITEEYND